MSDGRLQARSLALVLALVLAALLSVTPAKALAAGTLAVQDNGDGTFTLAFAAGAGDTNDITITQSGSTLTFTDTGAVINEAAPECTGNGTNVITCTEPGILFFRASLGNGDDHLRLDAPLESGGLGIQGGIGNDTLSGGRGHDSLSGDEGADKLDGREGDDVLNGGNNDMTGDEIRGGPGADDFSLDKLDGADMLVGGAGIDLLSVAEGFLEAGYRYTLGDNLPNDGFMAQGANLQQIEDLFGHEGSALVRGTADPNVATTVDGNDDVDLLGGPDIIDAGSQNDTIEARDGFSDRIQCGTGTDTVRADQLDQLSGCENVITTFVAPFGTPPQQTIIIPAGPAPATLAGCGPGRTSTTLGSGNDNRSGTPGADLIFAGPGNDVIDALAGDDCVDLGPGDDRGQGGSGTDLVVGGAGTDTVTGSAGNDRLRGDDGNDRLVGDTGNDVMLGGAGADALFGAFGDDSLQGEDGADDISGSRGRDTIRGGSGADKLSGGSSPDSVSGGAGNDRINGNSARDRLSGGTGSDRISARDRQRDRISCGSGRDRVRADRIDRVAGDCEVVRRIG